MKAKIAGDKKRRNLLRVYEKQKSLLKYAIQQDYLNKEGQSTKLLKKLHKLPRNSSRTRVKNRCTITGRSRSPLRMFKVSRLEFRRKAKQKFFSGIAKASW